MTQAERELTAATVTAIAALKIWSEKADALAVERGTTVEELFGEVPDITIVIVEDLPDPEAEEADDDGLVVAFVTDDEAHHVPDDPDGIVLQ